MPFSGQNQILLLVTKQKAHLTFKVRIRRSLNIEHLQETTVNLSNGDIVSAVWRLITTKIEFRPSLIRNCE